MIDFEGFVNVGIEFKRVALWHKTRRLNSVLPRCQVRQLRICVFRSLLHKQMPFFDAEGGAVLTHLLIVGARDIKDAVGDKLPIVIMSLGNIILVGRWSLNR